MVFALRVFELRRVKCDAFVREVELAGPSDRVAAGVLELVIERGNDGAVVAGRILPRSVTDPVTPPRGPVAGELGNEGGIRERS